MTTKKAVLLASGGLDSTTLAYWMLSNNIDFIPLFVNYGQHCWQTELATLQSVIPSSHKDAIEVMDVSAIYRRSNSRFIKAANLWEDEITADDLYLPYRNMLLFTIAASFAQTMQSDSVYAAFINSNHAKEIDCTKAFFNKMESILGDFGSVKIEMPFVDMSKYEVAQIGISLRAPIAKTFSCQASAVIPCGACPNCVDRLEALRKLENFS